MSLKVDELKAKLEASDTSSRHKDVTEMALLCIFCREVATSPILMHPFCGRIICCDRCTSELIISGGSVFPLCTETIGPEKTFVRLHGFEDVVSALKDV